MDVLQLRSEANDHPTYLSSNNGATEAHPDMPAVGITFTARCLESDSGTLRPLPNQHVVFLEDPDYTPVGPHLSFNPTSGVTDGRGKCSTTVWAIANSAPVDPQTGEYRTQVLARWLRPDGTIRLEQTLAVYLVAEPPHTQAPGYGCGPAGEGSCSPVDKAPFANPTQIRVHYRNLVKSVQISNGTNLAWTRPGRIGFVGNPDHWQIEFTEGVNPADPDSLTSYAWTDTYPIGSPARRSVVFYNMYQMDDQGLRPTDPLPPPWPSFEERHHLQSTANHEVGHALAFVDNPDARKALMYGIRRYFIWQTIFPQGGQSDAEQYEELPLLRLYPLPFSP